MRYLQQLGTFSLVAFLAVGVSACEDGAGVGPDREAGAVTVTMSQGSSGASASLTSLRASLGESGISAAQVPEGSVDSVGLAINEVQVLRFQGNATSTSSGQQGGWISLDVKAQSGDSVVVNLLDLPTNGEVTIASGQLDAGTYHNVRLFFEDAWITLNSAVTLGGGPDGQGGKTFEAGRHDLIIPSGDQTGVKIPTAQFTVDSDGAAVNVLADTDASIQNINATGRGLLMTPVLTAQTDGSP